MTENYYKQYEPIFGVWRITRLIGEGFQSKVFEMEREDFGVTYKAALKAITIPAGEKQVREVMDEGMDEKGVYQYFYTMVKDQVKQLAFVNQLKGNTNVVSFENHQVIEHKDGIGWDILIQMELLTPFQEFQKKHPITEREAARIGIDLCRALELCGKFQIIHGDVKPDNLFVSDMGDFKLGGFDVARVNEPGCTASSGKGTLSYMAPEVRTKGQGDAGSDLYSLGLVLYQLLNDNRLPFLPAAPAPVSFQDRNEALMKRFSGAPLPPPVRAGEQMAKILLKACAFRPGERYRGPEELRRDLEAYLRGGFSVPPAPDAAPVARGKVSEEKIPEEKIPTSHPLEWADDPDEEDTVREEEQPAERLKMEESPAQEENSAQEESLAPTESPAPAESPAGFSMMIQWAFCTLGKETVVCGQVQGAGIHKGDQVSLLKPDGSAVSAIIGKISRDCQETDQAEPGEKASLQLLLQPNEQKEQPGDLAARYDLLYQELPGCKAVLKRLPDQTVDSPDYNPEEEKTFSGKRSMVTIYDGQDHILRKTWYEMGDIEGDKRFFYREGVLKQVVNFDSQGSPVDVYEFNEDQRVGTLQVFEKGQLHHYYVYDYDGKGRISRCICYKDGGGMEWYVVAEYKSGGQNSETCFSPQGEILTRHGWRNVNGGVERWEEYRNASGQMTADRGRSVVDPESITRGMVGDMDWMY